MFQRAIWATIIRIYSYGKAVFSTSFESAATPKQAMTAFMSANLDYLRELITYEIDNNTPADQQRGRVVHPQSYTPVPIDGLIVSQGTLTDTIFTITPATEETTLQVSMPAPASTTETLTQYAQRIGLTEETTYTIMANIVDKNINILYPIKINSPYAINYQSYFGAVRLTLKHLLSEKPISQATLADLFDIVRIGNTLTPSFSDIAFGSGTWGAETLLRRNLVIGTLAVSAYNTTTQQVSNSVMNWIRLQNQYGIISEYAIQIWGKAENITNNDVIIPKPQPYDEELEYIDVESTNARRRYIDLDIKLTNNIYDVKAKVNITQTFGNWPGIFGCINENAAYRIGAIIQTTEISQYVYNVNIGRWYNRDENKFTIDRNQSFEIEIRKNATANINGQEVQLTYGEGRTPDNPSSFLIFYNKNNGGYSSGRFFYAKIYENDTLICNCIPVRKGNEQCVYDTIRKQLFYIVTE